VWTRVSLVLPFSLHSSGQNWCLCCVCALCSFSLVLSLVIVCDRQRLESSRLTRSEHPGPTSSSSLARSSCRPLTSGRLAGYSTSPGRLRLKIPIRLLSGHCKVPCAQSPSSETTSFPSSLVVLDVSRLLHCMRHALLTSNLAVLSFLLAATVSHHKGKPLFCKSICSYIW